MSTWFEWKEAPKAQYAVIGDPVSHSLSPTMQNEALRLLGRNEEYTAVRVPSEDFDQAMDHLAQLGYIGVNVTVPLKSRAYTWAKSMPRSERRMGVVNTLRLEDRAAINTDAPGLIDTLREAGVDPRCNVLFLGAGGTARALAIALVEAGANLRMWNRTRTNLDKMINELRIDVEVLLKPDPSDCQLILNTTSAGLEGAKIDVDWYSAPKKALAIDVFYSNEPTKFLFEAQSNGLAHMDGRKLLVAQGARSLEWWTGEKAPRHEMLEAIS